MDRKLNFEWKYGVTVLCALPFWIRHPEKIIWAHPKIIQIPLLSLHHGHLPSETGDFPKETNN